MHKAVKSTLLSSIICVTFLVAWQISFAQVRQSTNTVFFDDFTGPTLDRSKWNVRITGNTVNNEQQAYVDSSATLYIAKGGAAAGAQNGALVLQPRFSEHFTTKEGHVFDFLSARLDTRGKAEFTYGTFEARMKLPDGQGLWPAFWLLGTGDWPQTGEIDIMETVGEKDWYSVALHGPGYFGETPLVNKYFFPQGESITGWHVYRVDWTRDSLLFKIDDRLMYRATRPMIENYGPWAYDNAKYLILNFALGGAYPAKTNGIKTPYNGMPASTVQAIRRGKIRVLVDWVRVTRTNK